MAGGPFDIWPNGTPPGIDRGWYVGDPPVPDGVPFPLPIVPWTPTSTARVGWLCPRCRASLSPDTSVCPMCSISTAANTRDVTIGKPSGGA